MLRLPNVFLEPKKVFLLDGCGALLTFSLLIFGLLPLENLFGMPRGVVIFLAIFALLLAAFSLRCGFFPRENWRPFLRFVLGANLFYCALTAVLVMVFREELSVWGVLYFVLEIAVVLGVCALEWRVLQRAPSH